MIVDDVQARLAITVLDEKVAAIFGKRPRCPIIRFVPLISRHEVHYGDGRVLVEKEIIGTCDHKTNTITLTIRDSWPATVVHELTHLYNPGRRESWIESTAAKVGAYLKGTGPHPMGGKSAPKLLNDWNRGVKDWAKP